MKTPAYKESLVPTLVYSRLTFLYIFLFIPDIVNNGNISRFVFTNTRYGPRVMLEMQQSGEVADRLDAR